MCPSAVYISSALVLCLVLCFGIEDIKATLCTIPDGYSVWKDAIGSFTQVLLQPDAEVCNSTDPCTKIDPPRFLSKAVYLPEGQQVRICLNTTDSINHALLEVSKDAFETCNGSVGTYIEKDSTTRKTGNDSWITENSNSELWCTDSFTLEVGSHFYIVNSTDNCMRGTKAAVAIKRNICWPSLENQTRTCSGNGNCVTGSLEEDFTCVCCTGYTSTYCEKTNQDKNDTTKTDDDDKKVNPCKSSPCLNNATCHAVGTTFYACACADGFTGTRCQVPDMCTPNPCVFGVCQTSNNTRQCFCTPGYHGELCEKDYDDCSTSPCKNGGSCIDLQDRYTCVCPRGYTGTNCTRKVNLCEHNPCRNNSACIDLGTSTKCFCRSGFTGHNCEVNINECASNPCLHMGTCHDSVNGYWCACMEPHAGSNCEFTFDVFAPPMETEITEESSNSYLHNLYIVAGTLIGAICIVVAVVTSCYCRLHETYKKIRWKRLRSPKRSLEVSSLNKPRLSTDAIMEATSLTRDMQGSSSYSDTLSTRLV